MIIREEACRRITKHDDLLGTLIHDVVTLTGVIIRLIIIARNYAEEV